MAEAGGRRVEWSVVPAGLVALVGPPLVLSILFALRGGRGVEGVGTLVVAVTIVGFGVLGARMARVHSLLVGALAGEAFAIGSLFWGGAAIGIPFALVFTIGSGVLGGWWARREWGERQPSREALRTLLGVAAIGAVAVLALGLFS